MNRRVAVLPDPDPSITMTEPRPGIPSPREIDENYFARVLYQVEDWLRVNEPSPAFLCALRRFVRQMSGPQ
jgi:hypothetical protein